MLQKCNLAVHYVIEQLGLFCEKFNKSTNDDLRRILDLAIVADVKSKKIRSATSVKMYREYFEAFRTAVEAFNTEYSGIIPETISPQEFIHHFPIYCEKVREYEKRDGQGLEVS